MRILRRVRRLASVLIASLCLAQGATAAPPPTVPGLQSRVRQLEAASLVREAVDHEGLRKVLDRARFVSGSERESFGRTATFNLVTARVLRFGSAGGATIYLRWLRGHAAASLGDPVSISPLGFGADGFVFRPRGCGCHTETPTFLIAWRRGRDALTIVAAGARATPKTAGVLARRLDQAVT